MLGEYKTTKGSAYKIIEKNNRMFFQLAEGWEQEIFFLRKETDNKLWLFLFDMEGYAQYNAAGQLEHLYFITDDSKDPWILRPSK